MRMRFYALLVLSLASFLGASLFFGRAWAQEDTYDIPPPPPISGDYDEGPIEEIPPDEYIDGPVYDAPPEEGIVAPLPAGGNDPGNPDVSPANSGRFGFSDSRPRPSFRPGAKGGASGGGSFGPPVSGGVKFKIVEDEFWEKGKKRGRAPRGD